MSKRKLGFVTLAAVAASAFGAAAWAQTLQPAGIAEPVLAFRTTGDAMTVRVQTGGCTSARDFHVGVERSNGEAHVTLTRMEPDNCKGFFPEGTELSFNY